MKSVYIVIVNWNGWADTIECLESVMRSDYPDFRVIVVDNGSDDGSPDFIRAWAENRVDAFVREGGPGKSFAWPPVAKPVALVEYGRAVAEMGGNAGDGDVPLVLVRNDCNLGFAGGNNVGLRYVLAHGDGEYVWLLNNDTVVASDALSKMVYAVEGSSGVGICGSTLLYYDAPEKVQALGGGYYCKWIGLPWHKGRFGKFSPRIAGKSAGAAMNYVEGASMLVGKSFLEEVGLMCEDYFLFFEEADWAIRGRGRFYLAYAHDSVVYHKVGRTIGTSSNPARKSYICDYYNIRNRLFFTKKFFPYALPTLYLFLFFTLLSRILLGKWDRVVMIFRLLLNRRIEGLCGIPQR